ncbi:hypothetical protein [Salinimicrobium flavum]|uniref:FixH protein n=1 Tax=Salinimicrobium flavum TaxID=1737065 RepID=A0ABW5IUY4_9FLAO
MARNKVRRREKTSFWENQKLLSITAVLISIGTLLVFVYQTNLVRKQQYMSVFPYLEFQNHSVLSPNYKLVLKNKGIGPALITSRNIVIKGKTYDLDLGMYLEENLVSGDTAYFNITNIRKGNLISEKEGIDLVVLEPNTSRSGLEKLHGLIYNDSLEFVVEYESVYGERWQVSSKSPTPRRIN